MNTIVEKFYKDHQVKPFMTTFRRRISNRGYKLTPKGEQIPVSYTHLAGMAFEKALVVGVIPFIIPDLGKIIAISFISRPLLQRLKNQAYFAN